MFSIIAYKTWPFISILDDSFVPKKIITRDRTLGCKITCALYFPLGFKSAIHPKKISTST